MAATSQRASDGGAFNTLAQNETGPAAKDLVLLRGKGSDLSQTEQLNSKAKRKCITQSVVLRLIDIAKTKGNDEALKSLWNVYHCQDRIYTYCNRSFGRYCKSHICTLCCANRKADLINRYLPIVSTWPNPQFLTLTSKAVSAKHLKRNIEGTFRALSKILAAQRKKAQRGMEKPFTGIRSIECNFNPKRRTYNPHIHLILPDLATANALKKAWLKLWTPRHTVSYAQYIRPVSNTLEDLVEVIKYGSKIFVEPDKKTALNTKVPVKVYTKALYNIYVAMKGKRLFQRFGFTLPKQDRLEIVKAVRHPKEWHYQPQKGNWIGLNSRPLLMEFSLDQVKSFLESSIDSELE